MEGLLRRRLLVPLARLGVGFLGSSTVPLDVLVALRVARVVAPHEYTLPISVRNHSHGTAAEGTQKDGGLLVHSNAEGLKDLRRRNCSRSRRNFLN